MRLLVPLRTKAIALLWGGLSTSAIGDQLGAIAITWIAVDAFGAAAGYLTAWSAAVTLLAALFIGRWTDGRNERRVMIGADLIRAVVLIAIVVGWELTGHISAVSLAGLIITLAVGQAAFRPAMQTIMPALSPSPEILPATNALLDGTARLARMLGPALVALAAAKLPVAHFLTLDAATFLASAAAVLLIGRRPTRSMRHRAGVSFTQGFRAMHSHPLLRFLLRTSGLNNGAWYASFFLAVPLLLAGAGTDSVRTFGAVIACYGLTNLAGNLIVGNRPPLPRPARLIFSGNILNGAGIVLMGVCALVPEALHPGLYAGAILAGAGGPMNDIPRTTLMQTALPPADVAAAFRSWIVAANTGILVAMIVTPTLFASIGSGIGLAVLGGAIVIGGVWGLLLRLDAKPDPEASALEPLQAG